MIKNLYQRVTLTLGALAIGLAAIFPPWTFVFSDRDLRIERFAGYHPIWRSNAPTDAEALSEVLATPISHSDLGLVRVEIDTARLTIQIVAITLVTLLVGAVFAGFRKRQNWVLRQNHSLPHKSVRLWDYEAKP